MEVVLNGGVGSHGEKGKKAKSRIYKGLGESILVKGETGSIFYVGMLMMLVAWRPKGPLRNDLET